MFWSVDAFARIVSCISEYLLPCKQMIIDQFVSAIIVAGALIIFIVLVSESEQDESHRVDYYRNYYHSSTMIHGFAYASKKNIIHVNGSNITISRLGKFHLKMEQLVWHEVVVSRTNNNYGRLIAISRNAADSRIKIIQKYLPRELAMIVIDYMFKRLKKRRK